MRKQKLTGAVDSVEAQRRRRSDLSWSGSSSGALWSYRTYVRGERWGEMVCHRWSDGKQRRVWQRRLTRGRHGAGADEMQRWPPLIVVYCIEATRAYARMESGR
jgi:hypothetical protein